MFLRTGDRYPCALHGIRRGNVKSSRSEGAHDTVGKT
jgi:hypothetical protein